MTLDYCQSHQDRMERVSHLGFLCNAEEAAAHIAPYAPILEVGAGNGYLASKINARVPGQIIATDPQHDTSWCFTHGEHFPITRLTAARAVTTHTPNYTVLMCWPTLNHPWANIAAHRMAPGQRLIYIGEGAYGCTADDAFHKNLSSNFLEIAGHAIDQYHGIHDYLTIYQKKGE